MANFTDNLQKKIERSRSEITQIVGNMTERTVEEISTLERDFKRSLESDTEKLRKDMRLHGKELSKILANYRKSLEQHMSQEQRILKAEITDFMNEHKEQLKNDRAETNSRYWAMIILMLIVIALQTYPMIQNTSIFQKIEKKLTHTDGD